MCFDSVYIHSVLSKATTVHFMYICNLCVYLMCVCVISVASTTTNADSEAGERFFIT